MPSHRFKVGDIVAIRPAISRNVSGGSSKVIKVLPDRNGEREYRVKSANEPHERRRPGKRLQRRKRMRCGGVRSRLRGVHLARELNM